MGAPLNHQFWIGIFPYALTNHPAIGVPLPSMEPLICWKQSSQVTFIFFKGVETSNQQQLVRPSSWWPKRTSHSGPRQIPETGDEFTKKMKQLWKSNIPREYYVSICPSVDLSICLSVYLSINLSINLSTYLPIYLSIYISIYFLREHDENTINDVNTKHQWYTDIHIHTYVTYLYAHMYIQMHMYMYM